MSKVAVTLSMGIAVLLGIPTTAVPAAVSAPAAQTGGIESSRDLWTAAQGRDSQPQAEETPERGEPPSTADRRVGIKEFFYDTARGYAYLWGARFFYVRNKNSRIFDTSFEKWWDNITSLQVADGDDFITNFVNHPIVGGMYYLYYRRMGHDKVASAIGSAALSTLWEYAVEGLVEPPSLPDLIFTPGIGIPIGMGLEALSEHMEQSDNPTVRLFSYVVNPMKLFFKDRQNVLFNPITGTYAFEGPFTMDEHKHRASFESAGFSTESPLPLGRAMFSTEVVVLKGDFDGQFIFYSLRADFPTRSRRIGVYLKVPFGGVNDVVFDGNDVKSGFELGNTLLGVKKVLYARELLVVAAGAELYIPTIRKDNIRRLRTITHYTPTLPFYLRQSTTPSLYAAASLRARWLLVEGNLGTDLILHANKFEGDFLESRLRYSLTAAATANGPGRPATFVELSGFSLLTADESRKNDVLLTSGFRVGTHYSPGFAVRLPLAGESERISKATFLFDLQVRF